MIGGLFNKTIMFLDLRAFIALLKNSFSQLLELQRRLKLIQIFKENFSNCELVVKSQEFSSMNHPAYFYRNIYSFPFKKPHIFAYHCEWSLDGITFKKINNFSSLTTYTYFDPPFVIILKLKQNKHFYLHLCIKYVQVPSSFKGVLIYTLNRYIF